MKKYAGQHVSETFSDKKIILISFGSVSCRILDHLKILFLLSLVVIKDQKPDYSTFLALNASLNMYHYKPISSLLCT